MITAEQIRQAWATSEPETVLPNVTVPITRFKTALTPAVTLDGYPGHFSSAYARAAGLKTVFMNTMPLLGLLDRFATDWAGSEAFIARHEIDMVRPIYAGDLLTISGSVRGVSERQIPGSRVQKLLDIACKIHDEYGELRVKGIVSLLMPDPAS